MSRVLEALTRGHVEAFAADACLVYVTTCTCVKSAEAIVKELAKVRSEVNQVDRILAEYIVTNKAVILQVARQVKFIKNGSWILPGIDDNFVVDETVTLLLDVIIELEESKIKLVKLSWDQASALKQVGVIGTRGRLWPISNGVDQVNVVTEQVSASKSVETKEDTSSRHKLRLFTPEKQQPRDVYDQQPASASAKPGPRPYEHMFVNADSEIVEKILVKGGEHGPRRVFSFANKENNEDVLKEDKDLLTSPSNRQILEVSNTAAMKHSADLFPEMTRRSAAAGGNARVLRKQWSMAGDG